MRAVIATLLLVTSAAPAAQPASSTNAWWHDYARYARQVPIGGGRTLHILCEGRGSPTILLESGVGDGMTVWRKVQPALAQHYRVCAYDRAGLGLSPVGPQPRDLNAVVRDLEKLTVRARLRAPYLLVGHSFGTMTMRLYARRHLARISGIVLVDPPEEREVERAERIAPGMRRSLELEVERSRQCASAKEVSGDCEPGIPSDGPPGMLAQIRGLGRTHYSTQAAEMMGLLRYDDAEMERAGTDLGSVPLVVLTSEQFKNDSEMPPDKRAAVQKLWATMHDEIAAHSKRGTNRLVPGTGHYIHLERPDAVVAAVEEVAATK